MDIKTQGGVTVKMFVGCPINSEVRMHLKYSESWQQQKVLPSKDGEDLLELRNDGKEYVGALLERGELNMTELRLVAADIRSALHLHCPELSTETLEIAVIPQLFLA